MPLQIQLLREGRVLVICYTEPLEMMEVDAMVNRVNHEIFEPSDKIIYSISDLTQIEHLPPNVLCNARAINRKRHERAGTSVIVVKPGLLTAVARSLLKVIGSDHLLLSTTIDDALGKLDQLLLEETRVP